MSDKTKIIQFSRSKFIERDRSIAILRLNDAVHKVGQPVVVRYYETDGSIDTIFAIGVKDGIGEGCYKIISLGGIQVVRDIVYDPADVTELVHGETYIYYNNAQKKGYYIFLDETSNTREFIEITKTQEIYINVRDRYTWFWIAGQLKREDDFYTRKQIDSFFDQYNIGTADKIKELTKSLEELRGQLEFNTNDLQTKIDAVDLKYDNRVNLLEIDTYPLSIELTHDSKKLYLIGQTAEINTSLSVYRKGKSVTSDCLFKINNTLMPGPNNKLTTVNDMHYDFEASYQVSPTRVLKITTSLDVNFGYLFYFGTVDKDWVANQEGISALGENEIHGKEDKQIEHTFNLVLGKRLVVACPKIYGSLKEIKDGNGFDLLGNDYYTISEAEINSIPYLIYKSNEDVVINNLKQIYGY